MEKGKGRKEEGEIERKRERRKEAGKKYQRKRKERRKRQMFSSNQGTKLEGVYWG